MSSSGRIGATLLSRKASRRAPLQHRRAFAEGIGGERPFVENSGGVHSWAIDAAALRFCRAGIRSTRQLRDWLKRRGLEEREALAVVRICQERGLLDDTTAAKLWTEHWSRKGYSWSVIVTRLKAKGFERSRIAPLAEVYGGPADESRARQVVKGMRPGRGSARCARKLAARGFDTEVIERVLATEWR